MKVKRGCLLVNICSPSLQTSLFMTLHRWLLFPNRCATLSFTWVLCSLFIRVINLGNQCFPSIICSVLLHDRTSRQTAAHREMHSAISAPSFRKQALALLCKVQAKWAPLPHSLYSGAGISHCLERWWGDGWCY